MKGKWPSPKKHPLKAKGDNMNNSNFSNKTSSSSHVSIPKKFLYGAIGAVILVIAIFVFMNRDSDTIDLNKYMIIETSGFEGYGHVKIGFDWDAIKEKYGSKITYTEKVVYGNNIHPVDNLKQMIHVRIEDNNCYSNGDKVSYEIRVQDAVDKLFNCKLKYKDGSFKVSGLKKAETYDVFSDIYLEFHGVSGDGYGEINSTNPDLNPKLFTIKHNSGLSDGDKVTVSIDVNDLEKFAESIGKIPETFEKEYTVENLDKYVSDISDINDASFEKMMAQASDVFAASTADWSEGGTLEDFKYVGNYLLTSLDKYNPEDNILYLVYDVKTHNTYSSDTEYYDEVNHHYWFIKFYRLMVDSKGNLQSDLTIYNTPGGYVTIDSGISNGWFSNASWTYNGYSSIDEIYNAELNGMDAYYNIEDNVTVY